MIRDFESQDSEKIKKLLEQDHILEKETINLFLEDEDKTLRVYEDMDIKGFFYLKKTNSEEREYRVLFYVCPEGRRKGIGTILYNSAYDTLKELNANVLTTYFNVTSENPNEFYRNLGFRKWWVYHEAHYMNKKSMFDVDMTFIPYEDKYFHSYSKLIQDCFYELRKENDIKPYIVPFTEKDRENKASTKDSTYLSFEDEELVSAVVVKDGYIDTIVVSPSHQGKGLGRKATEFAINKALEQNPTSVHLSVLGWNKKAIELYIKLGFKITKTVHFYRQFCDKEF